MRTPSRAANSSAKSVGAEVTKKAKETVEALSQATDQVQERAGDALDAARAKTGDVQATVADKLEAGAEAIRQRVGDEGRSAVVRSSPPRIAKAGEVVADRLERSALWLRENDLTDLRTLIGQQLRSHPGRTALIALGLGLVLGRQSRR